MTENIFVARCRLLTTLAVADEKITPEEHVYLEQIMDRFLLTGEDRVHAMTVLHHDELAAAIASLSELERLAVLAELASLAWADGDLDDEEVRRLEEIADGMGYDRDDVQRLLADAAPH